MEQISAMKTKFADKYIVQNKLLPKIDRKLIKLEEMNHYDELL